VERNAYTSEIPPAYSEITARWRIYFLEVKMTSSVGVLRTSRCGDLRFYNLSLHPEAEARDLEVSGAAPIGSLLEWIDDIFETPVTCNPDRSNAWKMAECRLR
jgi:hypothetical protein